jgi:excisionase family DNA binding protein
MFFRVKATTLFPELDRRKTVTLGDLSEQSGIPLRTIQDQVARGEIPGAFRSGKGKGRKWRIRRSDAERWWQEMQRVKI